MNSALKDVARELVGKFEAKVGLADVQWELKERSDGALLTLLLGHPNDRFFRALRELNSGADDSSPLRGRVTIKHHSPPSWVLSPEARLLQRVLSESLTVSQHSFEEDFFSRYIPSVAGAEEQITSTGNHIVFGRRGSGKSSLLVYAMRTIQAAGKPFVWIAMQTYDQRSDIGVAADMLTDVLTQLPTGALSVRPLAEVLTKVRAAAQGEVTASSLRLLIPEIKRVLSKVVGECGPITIFLDDLHVISPDIQPAVLSLFYAFCRGNRTYLKVSAIEQFTRVWDPSKRAGLETPNDAQVIRLDYNLTKPDKSLEHISNILTAHAKYCGLPSISVLCAKEAMSRLVWVAAGVPRDAINMFAQAMIRAVNEGEKKVSVTGINMAASQAADDKMRFVEMDSSGELNDALIVLERIKQFCIAECKKNAFLVEIKNHDELFENVRKLIDLRFLHVLNPSITPDRAGVRWQALLLDYGFYTGVRAGKSIDLFQREARAPEVKELRKLPRFHGELSTDGRKPHNRRPPSHRRETSLLLRARTEERGAREGHADERVRASLLELATPAIRGRARAPRPADVQGTR